MIQKWHKHDNNIITMDITMNNHNNDKTDKTWWDNDNNIFITGRWSDLPKTWWTNHGS